MPIRNKHRRSKQSYGTGPYGHNYLGDTRPTKPHFAFACVNPSCKHVEWHTKPEGVYYHTCRYNENKRARLVRALGQDGEYPGYGMHEVGPPIRKESGNA